MEKQNVFEKKSVWGLMAQLCIPTIVIMLVTIVYSMTDLFFVGKLENVNELAAVSLASPLTGLMSTLGMLIGGGGCVFIARALGQKNEQAKNAAVGGCLLMTILAGLLCTALILGGMELFFPLLGVTAETEPYVRSYLTVMAIGAPFVIFAQGFSNIARSEGAMKEAMIGNLLGNLTNMLLDPLLILVLQGGVTGAAIATVIGNLVSTVYLVGYFVRGKGSFTFRPSVLCPAVKCAPATMGTVLALGLPSAAGNLLMNFAHGFQNRYLTQYGSSTVAAFGVAGKATMIVALIGMGIAVGIQPALSYFYGAGNREKLGEIVRKSALVATLTCGLLTVGCYLGGEQLVRLFVSNPETVALGVRVVRISLLSAPFFGLYYLGSNLLQASGNAVSATVASVLRQGLILIPALAVMHAVFGFNGLLWTGVLSDLLSLLLTLLLSAIQLSRPIRSTPVRIAAD